MSVSIQIPSILQQFTGGQWIIEAEGQKSASDSITWRDNSRELSKGYAMRKVSCLSIMHIYVSGERAYPEELTMPANTSDELVMLLAIIGG